jgi:hypothetical protein
MIRFYATVADMKH